MRLKVAIAAAAAALLGSLAHAGPPPAKVALTGARIIPIVGEEISEGTVLIEHGKIAAVGAEVEIPYDAVEVDCTGKVVMPGVIDPHSPYGLDVTNENLPVAPFLNVADAIDPSRTYFEQALRSGVTSTHVIPGDNTVIGGVSRVVRPIGRTIGEMTVVPDVAMKMSVSPRRGFDRMQQLATIRETFAELNDYLDNLAEQKYDEKLEEDDELIDVAPDEARKRGKELIEDDDYDDKHANLVRMQRGDLATWIYADRAMDVAAALKVAQDYGLIDNTVLVLGTESYKAIKRLETAGRPVVLDPELFHRERDPVTGKLDETFVPKVVHDAGLTFALQPNPSSSVAERYLTYQAAVCVRNGVPRSAALEAITINPAKILGMGDMLGSIEAGKSANVLVLSGDPLEFTTWVEKSYIDGKLAYDRERDHRLHHLLGVEKNKADEEKDETKDADAEPDAEEAADSDDASADEGDGE